MVPWCLPVKNTFVHFDDTCTPEGNPLPRSTSVPPAARVCAMPRDDELVKETLEVANCAKDVPRTPSTVCSWPPSPSLFASPILRYPATKTPPEAPKALAEVAKESTQKKRERSRPFPSLLLPAWALEYDEEDYDSDCSSSGLFSPRSAMESDTSPACSPACSPAVLDSVPLKGKVRWADLVEMEDEESEDLEETGNTAFYHQQVESEVEDNEEEEEEEEEEVEEEEKEGEEEYYDKDEEGEADWNEEEEDDELEDGTVTKKSCNSSSASELPPLRSKVRWADLVELEDEEETDLWGPGYDAKVECKEPLQAQHPMTGSDLESDDSFVECLPAQEVFPYTLAANRIESFEASATDEETSLRNTLVRMMTSSTDTARECLSKAPKEGLEETAGLHSNDGAMDACDVATAPGNWLYSANGLVDSEVKGGNCNILCSNEERGRAPRRGASRRRRNNNRSSSCNWRYCGTHPIPASVMGCATKSGCYKLGNCARAHSRKGA